MVEQQRGFLMEVKLVFPVGASTNASARAMRGSFDADALSVLYAVGSHGGLVISRAGRAGTLEGSFYTSCPYSKTKAYTFLGPPIPAIPRTPDQHTANTYGQYAVLQCTGNPGSSVAGFFVEDAAGFFDRLYEGVRFRSDTNVYVHVCVLRNSSWVRFVSDPLVPPPLAIFHRNPYCVTTNSLVYMMYLIGFIVCFDLEHLSFGVLSLPGEMAQTVRSWFDYTVGPHPEGDLAVFHLDNGTLVRWVLVREGDSVDWNCDSSVDLADAFGDIISNPGMIGGLSDRFCVQVRCASPDARFVLISVGLNEGVFVVDMSEKKVRQTPQHCMLGRVFPLSENWPPRP